MSPAQRKVLLSAVLFFAFLGGGLLAWSGRDDGDRAAAVDGSEAAEEPDGESGNAGVTTSITSTTAPVTPSSTTTTLPPDPVVQVFAATPPNAEEALAMAATLATEIALPSDCGLPLDVPESLPNSPREYRTGTHQGIDFICMRRGREAVVPMPGRVLVAVGDYVDPTPAERSAVLSIAEQAGSTPPWTLAMMYGNFVVLDHGVIDGVGHVVSVHAHFESLDDAITPGVMVEAGQRLGEIGNKGTNAASQGTERPQSIHLHWELYVDDLYLGAGLGFSDTREIYRTLFAESL